MKININYPQLAAEFVIVFVGVAVALAADGWREDFKDRGFERAYLTRIKSELENGEGQLERLLDRFSTAFDSSNILISNLEENSGVANETLLVEHFTKATRTGRPGAGLSHGAVFSELLSTGRLILISNPDLRVALSDYYRSLDGLSLELGTLPRTPWERYRELTGNEASYYLTRGELPVGAAADRLIAELSGGNLSVRHFRLLRTRLGLITNVAENQLMDNTTLLELVNSEIN